MAPDCEDVTTLGPPAPAGPIGGPTRASVRMIPPQHMIWQVCWLNCSLQNTPDHLFADIKHILLEFLQLIQDVLYRLTLVIKQYTFYDE